jgi:hypothetical protein
MASCIFSVPTPSSLILLELQDGQTDTAALENPQ